MEKNASEMYSYCKHAIGWLIMIILTACFIIPRMEHNSPASQRFSPSGEQPEHRILAREL